MCQHQTNSMSSRSFFSPESDQKATVIQFANAIMKEFLDLLGDNLG